IHLKTRGVSALRLDRDPALIDADAEVALVVDGKKLDVDASDAIALHRDGDAWTFGPAPTDAIYKEGHVTGPIRDVWNEPLQIVYGASDPNQVMANREVAKALGRIRWGVDVDYPMLRDDEIDPMA